jgi:hypothetical protein
VRGYPTSSCTYSISYSQSSTTHSNSSIMYYKSNQSNNKLVTSGIRVLLLLFIVAITPVQAQAKFRYQKFCNSILIDDDVYGTRLVLVEEYSIANRIACEYYVKINPQSSDLNGNAVSLDILPRRFLPNEELYSWAATKNINWWQQDAIIYCYRHLERWACAVAGVRAPY